MSTPDTWFAYFAISGSFDPAEITHRLGMSPTYAVRLGDPGRYTKAVKCSRWELRSRVEETSPIEEHVNDVLDQLDTNKSGFVQLSRELGGTMQPVGYFREREPGVHFEQETVRRIEEYSLCIDCDFYNRSAATVGMTGELTKGELGIINNALNEVCNGIHLEGEFDTRMGCTVEEARALLAKIHALASD
jgi:Domain of unknown function (DUF4279)